MDLGPLVSPFLLGVTERVEAAAVAGGERRRPGQARNTVVREQARRGSPRHGERRRKRSAAATAERGPPRGRVEKAGRGDDDGTGRGSGAVRQAGALASDDDGELSLSLPTSLSLSSYLLSFSLSIVHICSTMMAACGVGRGGSACGWSAPAWLLSARRPPTDLGRSVASHPVTAAPAAANGFERGCLHPMPAACGCGGR
ncbi:hypothetical protein PR202_ga00441 [Eleusine coracana subsp. coracana]|uniref:Uncharacterized protein n=1 Tax=Eleusine coracana subsp. coracana TaxID=191504 RepID=A0AAV5BEL2_ELECO|nr:hypothetical protein PR202_ga00441 [Eleusine coracana subsp. coracana]